MTFGQDVPSGSTDFYTALVTGNDGYIGTSVQQPKKTLSATKAAIDLLSPFAFKTWTTSQGALLTEVELPSGIQIPDRCTTNWGNLAISGDIAACITPGSTETVTMASVGTSATNGIGYHINGINQCRVIGEAQTAADGQNSSGVRLDGVCDDIFINTSQMRAGDTNTGDGDGSTCILIKGESDLPIDVDVNTATLESDDCLFLDVDSSDPNTELSGTVSSVVLRDFSGGGTPTGCIAFRVTSGCVTINAGLVDMQAETAIYVASGAKLNIECTRMLGDIIVEAGGELNCDIITHDGNIFAIGTVNGNINGARYGTYIEGNDHFVTWFRRNNLPNSWDTFGTITLDSAVYKLDACDGSFEKTTGLSRTVDFRLIDADTADVYFTGTVTTSSTGKISVNLSTSVAFPSSGNVRMNMQVQRNGGGAFGLFDAGATLQFSVR